MKNFDLVSFGDTVVDFTPAGKTNKGTNLYERNPGGSTSNVACGVSRLGKKVAVMSAVGDDVIGHYLSQVLVENNIDVSSLVFTPNYSTFLAFVDIDETGNRTFYSLSNGVNDASLRGFTLNDVDKQMLLETRIFHTSGCTFVYDTTRAVTQYAMQVVKEAGGMISFDLTGEISEKTQLLLQSMLLGIEHIAEEYGKKYVQIINR